MEIAFGHFSSVRCAVPRKDSLPSDRQKNRHTQHGKVWREKTSASRVLAALASSPATKALDPDPFPRHPLRHPVYAALLHFGFETARNTFLVRWQLGLAAIYAEAEDPQWAMKLTGSEAELAARYAPIELNGFPAWLEALAAAHPKAVDTVLGEELSRSLAETVENNNASIWLQNIQHATPSVTALFLPRVQQWLEETRGRGFNNNPELELQIPIHRGQSFRRIADSVPVIADSFR